MRARVVSLTVLVSLAFGACTSSCRHDPSSARSSATPPTAPARETQRPEAPTLVLEAASESAATARYVSVRLGPASRRRARRTCSCSTTSETITRPSGSISA